VRAFCALIHQSFQEVGTKRAADIGRCVQSLIGWDWRASQTHILRSFSVRRKHLHLDTSFPSRQHRLYTTVANRGILFIMTQFRHAFSLDKQELNEMAPPGTVTLMGEWRINR
jgi:hypothetical protein